MPTMQQPLEEPVTRLGDPKEPPASTVGRLLFWAVPLILVLVGGGGAFLFNQYAASVQQNKIAVLTAGGVRINERTDSSAPQWLRHSLGEDFFTSPISVSFEKKEVSDEAIAALAKLPSVRSVDLALTDANDQQVMKLAKLNLRDLYLKQTLVTDESIPAIARFAELEKLQLAETGVTDAGVNQLGGLARLTHLWLDDTAVSDDCLATIGKLEKLEVLSLNRTQVTGSGMVHFPDLQNLQTLRLSGCPLQDTNLIHLENIAELSNSLDVSNTPLADRGADLLEVLTYLKQMNITGVNFTPERIARLKRTLPACRFEE